MTDTTGLIVFVLVVAARFLLPITIPRYPLPGILVCLVLDGVDQTIFQQFPGINLEGYQGYDKALDIYYLTIAFNATFRNWTNYFALQVSRFLFYWRLIGVVLFEILNLRPLLLVFPNSFEYFFIFYEIYRLRWDPDRMTHRSVLGAATFIWVAIKLPQEWWLHIAQLDVTDTVKSLFGAPTDAAWGEIFAHAPFACAGSFLSLGLVTAAAVLLLRRRLPAPHHRLPLKTTFPHDLFAQGKMASAVAVEAREIMDTALLEKFALVAMVCVIFVQILPDIVATNLQAFLGVFLVVTIDATISHTLARLGYSWVFSLTQSALLLAVNSLLFVIYAILMASFVRPVRFTNALFFVLLLMVLITLYDRYRQVYLMRFGRRLGLPAGAV